MDATLIFLIVLALAFDFVNGLHDAANSIATVVSTRVLSPRMAVAWAAFFNFVAYAVFSQAVAKTIGKGIVIPEIIDYQVIAGALAGAIFWNIVTWYYGIPSSSSHALMGGLIGAALLKGGVSAIILGQKLYLTLLFIIVSPVAGMLLAILLMSALAWTFRNSTPSKVDRVFRKGQLLSAAAYSLGHGGNDAQKTMGIIAALLVAGGHLGKDAEIPLWVVLTCHAAMGAGTLCGGWRIVKTMGTKITALQPYGGFCAETAGAAALFGATALGIPVSTTHTITGAITGVGTIHRLSAVRWGVAGKIVWAWVLTIPAAAAFSALTWWVCHQFGWLA